MLVHKSIIVCLPCHKTPKTKTLNNAKPVQIGQAIIGLVKVDGFYVNEFNDVSYAGGAKPAGGYEHIVYIAGDG